MSQCVEMLENVKLPNPGQSSSALLLLVFESFLSPVSGDITFVEKMLEVQDEEANAQAGMRVNS